MIKDGVFTVALQSGAARQETFLGRTFRVVPAVLVRSQVLRNNLGATYLPAEAITDEWASLWNGIPVLVGPHPSERGVAVSGRSPALLNERGAGWIFNARADQESTDVRRLVAEVWLDESRAEAVVGLQEVLDQVLDGHPVELSTGFPVHLEQRVGLFQGEEFDAVLQPAGADHLVISTTMTGACGVSDGCGLGVNKKETPVMEVPTQEKGRWAGVLNKAAELFNGRQEKRQTAWEEDAARNLTRELEADNGLEPSDDDRRMLLRGALQAKFGGSDREVVVMDTYSDQKQIVFWLHTPLGSVPSGQEYFRVTYTEEEGGTFNFDEPTRVRRMVAYEPVGQVGNSTANAHNCGCKSKKEEAQMQESDKKELVAELKSEFAGLLQPVTEQIAGFQASVKETAEAAANAAVEGVKTQVEALGATVAELAKTVNSDRDTERQALVTELSSNERTPFTAAELEAKPLDELRKIAHLAKVQVTNYSGRGGPRESTNSEQEPAYMPVAPYFAKNTAKAEA